MTFVVYYLISVRTPAPLPITIIVTHQFVFFPFLIGNIDISSVGPPPTS